MCASAAAPARLSRDPSELCLSSAGPLMNRPATWTCTARSAPVDQQEHSVGTDRRGRDELQGDGRAGLAEQLAPVAEDGGEDDEPELVDEALVEQRVDQTR